ncbi:conserved hypothetical protein [Leishmania infantum JPCM5]|uniref:Uncharacterized protein n=2 Tax=Leishmania infantum TaxID=5671 RepID=A4I5S1_LEIIN|nr:conserved hypothetical protein [Leishmania infantum JPCM5]CAC9514733.1 hypothetical_protein_-_conserved [Leishmania infantum]CAM70142.1 conserved hypothetical protein [Leishmania infantum JPCM5]SUZ44062.1 hypothetical_protein_-_conserved [Leishmania infantum]|eukprot:XP_001467090.1 conserved hypothetical protein [Leishmania infantum JPCM5]
MFKSSLATHSSIDHDLFPLLTVRSCVSEADESKNGPRFCAEDKMTGGAYEIRSRKLDLEAEQLVDGVGCRGTHRNLSPNDLRAIRRQQERIDALLTATAHCAVPPCVALPIDVYIQEQPSTGHTYVASVDAFSGLSLGDIIRSGWGMMEESVFLEILNAVEAFGYASASLPPHGNISSDAIKQLLIVRDGASEARQPSRWVVSDWLLLSDDSVTSFDPQAFVADLEWVLHSSFAQLHISTTTTQGSTFMPAARVEELVTETVDRIRAHLLHQGAEAHHTSSADALAQPSDGGPQTDMKAFHAHLDASSSGVTDVDGASARQTSASNEDGVPTSFDTTYENTANWASGATGSALESQATAPPSSPPRSVPDPSTTTASTAAASSLNTLPAASLVRNKSQDSRGAADKRDSAKEAFRVARHMSLKDKVAYHQAALRREQLLVNRHRRKNAPLPPRPQPVSAHIQNARPFLSPSASEEDEEFYYDPPALTSPIDVKPSAYLMQGRRSSPNRRGAGSARKLQSPRSARTLNGEARTPCERSRSSTTPPPSQRSQATSHASASCDQLRERLLDDVVSIAVLNQRRRAEDHLLQQEAERRRREQRQQVLSLSTPPRGVAGQRLSTPNLLDNPGASISYPAAPSSPSVEAKAAETGDNHRRASRRRGTAPCGSAANVSHGGSASPSGCCLVLTAAPHDAAMNRFGDASKSPEPTPPSPHWCRIVRPTFCENKPVVKAAAGTRVALPQASARGAASTAVASRLPQTAGKTTAPSQTVLYGLRTGTASTIVRSDAAKMPVTARAAATMGGVATAAMARNGSNLSRQLAAGTVPRSSRSTTTAGNRAAWAVGQQQRSARARAAAPLVQRNTRASTSSPLSSPREKTAQQSAAAPCVKPLPFASFLGCLASPREAPTLIGASSPPLASRAAVGQLVPARRAAATTSGSLSYSNGSTRKYVMDAKFQALRCPNTARPPPTQLRLATSPRVYQRVSSTGVLRSPRNGVGVTPLRQPSAATPATAPQSSSSIREVSRSVLQKPAKLEAATPIALRTTQPRLPVAADSASAKGRASVSRKPLQRLVLQKGSPGLSARHADTLDTQATDLPPTSANEDSLTSPHTPPPPSPPPLASTNAAAAAAGAVRRFTCTDPLAQSSVAEVENHAPRGRNAGGSSLSPGSRSMEASAFATQRENKGKAHVAGPCAEPLTLGSVRPVKKASPGILLLRHRSSTM